MKKDGDIYFKTPDLYIASVLRAANFVLVSVETTPIVGKYGKNKKMFVFERLTAKIPPEEVIKDYWGHNLQMDARDLVDAINELKTRLFE